MPVVDAPPLGPSFRQNCLTTQCLQSPPPLATDLGVKVFWFGLRTDWEHDLNGALAAILVKLTPANPKRIDVRQFRLLQLRVSGFNIFDAGLGLPQESLGSFNRLLCFNRARTP